MFDCVLIANRGEIAVRIIRTLRRLGIRSVAVYSDADADARHVAEADTSVHIGPAAAAQSYLSVDRIIEAALRTGAQALHPGYGFLSENVALATACAQAGVVFIGPPPAAIEAMGDKIRAKRTVSANGVRVVPGIAGDGLSADQLLEAAREVGLPALIKPSAGGGGKGMRLITSHDQWTSGIAAAQREAMAAFGDDTLLIERYVERPRHIEVQVLADSHGNVVHLGERECSLQRRHQKVIEEAPSPLLDEHHRRVLGEQAVAAARACGYVNAGTVEFVVSGDRPDEAFFLEMNTRLQVEHPVTEMVWGIDLVEQQLRVAAGAALGFAQSDLAPNGHAFEARVYAEDPSAGFLPTGGAVSLLREPIDLPHVRVDSSLAPGMTVGSDYDPMLSKVIAWGATRDEARLRLDSALARTQVLGVVTNVSFLRDLLGHADVVAGSIDTGLIDRFAADTRMVATPATVAVAAALTLLGGSTGAGPWDERRGWRLAEPATIAVRMIDSRAQPVEVRLRHSGADTWHATVEDWSGIVDVRTSDSAIELTVGGLSHAYLVVRTADSVSVGCAGAAWAFRPAPSAGSRRNATADAGLNIASPMPGTVVSVDVAVGDTVQAGQPVVVVEAMKMEHTLRAGRAAVVREVAVSAGDRVDLHQVLVVLDASDHQLGE